MLKYVFTVNHFYQAEELANFTKDHPSLGEQVANEVDDKDTDSSQNTQTPVAPPLALQVKEVDKPTPQNLLKVSKLTILN